MTADRVFVTNVSRATTLDEGKLALVTRPWVKMSLRLEAKVSSAMERCGTIKYGMNAEAAQPDHC